MTTYDDGVLAAQFAALAPEPLEGKWDDVLRAATLARDDAGRVERPAVLRAPRRYLLAFVGAVLIAVMGTAAYGAVRVLVLNQGFIGLPPVGATASSPESSDLVVESFAFAPPLSPQQKRTDMVRAWVYADGRIIWDRRTHGPEARRIPHGANEFNSGYLEQRLSPDGVELVRTALAELLDRNRALMEEIPAGEDPWWGSDHQPRLSLFVPKDLDSQWGVLAVRHGEESARLLWSRGPDGSTLQGTAATPEQLSALRRVEALLNDPATVLPSSAWAVQEVRAYVPSHYAVCIDTSLPRTASALVSMLPVRAAELLRDKGHRRAASVMNPGVSDCYELETEDAREVADALSGLVPENGSERSRPAGARSSETYGLRWRVDKAVEGQPAEWNATDVAVEPVFPDGKIAISAPFG